jgi:hypothetical protein
LVETARVHPSRRRAAAVTGIAIVLVAGFAAVSSLTHPRDADHSRGEEVTRGVADQPAETLAPGVAVGVSLHPLAVSPAELHVRVSTADLPPDVMEQLDVAGWVPSGFDWATIDILVATIPVASAGRQVSADGTFSATLPVPDYVDLSGGVVVRLSGLGYPARLGVPLATVRLAPSPFAGPRSDRLGYVLE